MADWDQETPRSSKQSDAKKPQVEQPQAYSFSIVRDGVVVSIKLEARNEYTSMELYDRLVNAAKQGIIKLNLQTLKHKER